MPEIPTLTTLRSNSAQVALIFLHGFGGNPATTWGDFPGLIQSDSRISDWDLFTVGYATALVPDIVGIWKANAPLDRLAFLLHTVTSQKPLDRYRSVALIAHSMGGLITQRALLDHDELAARVSHLFFFGTPSAGLAKAGPFAFLKRQMRDMGDRSEFVLDVRKRWTSQFGSSAPFRLWTIAGDQDEFVPSHSSLDPFPPTQREVVAGSHISIVKPTSADDLGFKIVLKGILGDAAPAGSANAARLAVESRDFVKAVQLFQSHPDDLDPQALVAYALALEETGRQAEAIQVLEKNAGSNTDALGVLAGRLKRRWLVERRRSDAERALALYKKAYDLSIDKANASSGAQTPNPWNQGFYHGINIAFMELAYGSDDLAAKAMAAKVLQHCERASLDMWRLAAEADAHLILGDTETALSRYRQAAATQPSPRAMKSMCQQALRLADLMNDDVAQKQLEGIWSGQELKETSAKA